MMTSMYHDTIAAVSTPLGEGGIGIVRLSGDKALDVVETIFTGRLENRRLSYGYIVDPETGQRVDEVLVSYMAAPHTYTREDVVEINCHGGPMPLQQVLRLTLRQGARSAQPGEFTLRAFLNGRIDLVQAESVQDLIAARTEAASRMALDGLNGRLSAAIEDIRRPLLQVLAYLSAMIDFPEEVMAPDNQLGPLEEALESLGRLIKSAETGMICRQGIRTAIVGRPNVGKSSILNRLLRQDRAIVTAIPGTTRDTIEEVVSIGGVAFVLIDTAGIVETGNLPEALSVERSLRASRQADLILLVIDRSEPLNEADREIIRLVADRRVLVVANKADLPPRAEIDGVVPCAAVVISALTGAGLDQLERKMSDVALGGQVVTSDIPLVGNPRHRAALEEAEQKLAQAILDLRQGMPDDFVTVNLTAALNSLGQITGQTVHADLMRTIFAHFCVGK